jgi:hypothetical protein
MVGLFVGPRIPYISEYCPERVCGGWGVRFVRFRINHVLQRWKQIMNSESVHIVRFVVSRLLNMYVLVQQL